MNRRQIYFMLLCALLLVVTGCSVVPVDRQAAEDEEATPQPYGTAVSESDRSIPTVRLGFHYKPLDDGTSEQTLASEASFMILTKKDEAFRDDLRAAGYEGLILQYVLANEIDGPKTKTKKDKCDEDFEPWQNQVANRIGDFCTYFHPNEDWFLHNGEGERMYSTFQDRIYYHMNPASEGWRAFQLERLKERTFGDEDTPPLGYDGIFFDNIELTMRKPRRTLENADGTVKEFKTDEQFREAWVDWLSYMRKGLGPSMPLWANMVAGKDTADEWNDFIPYLDGMMNEAFATGYEVSRLDPEEQTNHLKQVEYAIKQGKGVYLVSQGDQDDTELQQFALGSYLLVMQPNAQTYFRYTHAKDGGYPEWWTYDNYDVQLGLPIGPRYKVKNGWRRDFTNGYVIVNQVERTAKIVQDHSQPSPKPDPGGGN